MVLQEFLQAAEHSSGLNGMRRRADTEIVSDIRKVELPKEYARHFLVVVLARVNDDLSDPTFGKVGVVSSDRPRHGGALDELGARPDDAENDHESSARSSALTRMGHRVDPSTFTLRHTCVDREQLGIGPNEIDELLVGDLAIG